MYLHLSEDIEQIHGLHLRTTLNLPLQLLVCVSLRLLTRLDSLISNSSASQVSRGSTQKANYVYYNPETDVMLKNAC